MLMSAATVVQQLCKSCRTCFKFYCMFYFTCDRSLYIHAWTGDHLLSVRSDRVPMFNRNAGQRRPSPCIDLPFRPPERTSWTADWHRLGRISPPPAASHRPAGFYVSGTAEAAAGCRRGLQSAGDGTTARRTDTCRRRRRDLRRLHDRKPRTPGPQIAAPSKCRLSHASNSRPRHALSLIWGAVQVLSPSLAHIYFTEITQ